MTTPLRFCAFVMDTTSHIVHGAWRLPGARQHEFASLDLWVDLARTLEAGGFDAIYATRRREGARLRGRLTGRDRLPQSHPAASWRGAFAPEVARP